MMNVLEQDLEANSKGKSCLITLEHKQALYLNLYWLQSTFIIKIFSKNVPVFNLFYLLVIFVIFLITISIIDIRSYQRLEVFPQISRS